MRALLTGTVVDTDRNEWSMNGKSGVAYAVFVRETGGSQRDAAQRVKVSAEQFGLFQNGDEVELPVNVAANTTDRGTARLAVVLVEEFGYAAAKS